MTEPVSRWIDAPVTTVPLSYRIRLGSTPVIVEVVPWDGGAEVMLRPARRPIITWSERRAKRYFDLAHDAADQIARAFSGPRRLSVQRPGYRPPTRVRTGGQGGTSERRTGKRVVASSA